MTGWSCTHEVLFYHSWEIREIILSSLPSQTRKDSSAKKREKKRKVRTCLGCRRAQTLTFSIRRRHQTWFSALTKKKRNPHNFIPLFFKRATSRSFSIARCPFYRVFLFLIKLLDNWPWPAGETHRERLYPFCTETAREKKVKKCFLFSFASRTSKSVSQKYDWSIRSGER